MLSLWKEEQGGGSGWSGAYENVVGINKRVEGGADHVVPCSLGNDFGFYVLLLRTEAIEGFA